MTRIFSFLRRAREKWNYHTAKDPFKRMVAEINRNQQEIRVQRDSFLILRSALRCNIQLHGFLVSRFGVFQKLSLRPNAKFEIVDDRLIYCIGDLKVRITTAEELSIADEVFHEKIYAMVVPEEYYMVIDIGMNVGFASLFFAHDRAVKKVFSYEPFKPTFSDALFNFRLNPAISDKICPSNIALGFKDESLSIPYSQASKGKNSIANKKGDSIESIEVREAASMIEEVLRENAEENFYIKIDCEGSEFDIFRSFAGRPLPVQIKGILLEWHKYYPYEIVGYLRLNSFRIQQRGGGGIGFIVAFRE